MAVREKASKVWRATKTAGLVALVAGTVAFGGARARGDVIDVTSFEQLLSTQYPPTTQGISLPGNFTVNGETPTKRCSLGFGKTAPAGTAIVGYADQFPGFPNWLSGIYNGDPNYTDPLDNVLCLVLNENPSENVGGNFGIMILYDSNDNNRYGTLDTGTGSFTPEPDEFYYHKDYFIIAGVKGNIEVLMVFTGTDETLSQPSIDFIPEPSTLTFLGLGAASLLSAGSRKRK